MLMPMPSDEAADLAVVRQLPVVIRRNIRGRKRRTKTN